MDLTLSLEERTLFCAALAAILSSTRDDDERWGRGVAAALGALVGGASAAVVLQCGRAVRAFGDGIGDELLRRFIQAPYLPRLTPSPIQGIPTASAIRTRVWCRPAPTPPHSAGFTHALHGDAEPHSLGDGVTSGRWYGAVGATAELGIPDVYASVACHYHHPQEAEDTGRRLEMLRLLLPAFAAAARERLLAVSSHGQLTKRLLDTVSAGALLYSSDAGIFYENHALTRALDAHPDGARLRLEVERIARAAGRVADAGLPGTPTEERVAAETRELRTSSGAVVVRCTLVSPAEAGRPATVAVALEAAPTAAAPAALSAVELRERFGLTARELDVTHLLSSGKSNADIARELGISPFTARHHTERVLDKLGARSRAEVPALLWQ